jgi:hypothetical protein
MTTGLNGETLETPEVPGFRFFREEKPNDLGWLSAVFNALKISVTFPRSGIFHALKTCRAGRTSKNGVRESTRGGTAMQPSK